MYFNAAKYVIVVIDQVLLLSRSCRLFFILMQLKKAFFWVTASFSIIMQCSLGMLHWAWKHSHIILYIVSMEIFGFNMQKTVVCPYCKASVSCSETGSMPCLCSSWLSCTVWNLTVTLHWWWKHTEETLLLITFDSAPPFTSTCLQSLLISWSWQVQSDNLTSPSTYANSAKVLDMICCHDAI